MDALGMEELEDGTIGTRFHGISYGQTVCIGEGKALVGVIDEFLFGVGVEGRPAGCLDALLGSLRREEYGSGRVGVSHVELGACGDHVGGLGSSVEIVDSECKSEASCRCQEQ